MKPETLQLVAAIATFLFFFGASIVRAIAKPERGSDLDLTLGRIESFTADFDKSGRLKEKAKQKAAEKLLAALQTEKEAKDELVARASEQDHDEPTHKKDETTP